MLEIDGSRYSGSGTIIRQAVAFAALTGQSIRVVNARVRRPKPGLRHQHIQVVEAIRQLVRGQTEGVERGSREFIFRPGKMDVAEHYVWDIGSAGSTILLALAIMPILAFRATPATVELRGGIFQDFAPTAYHLQHVVLSLLLGMGLRTDLQIRRPGYVPRGGGIVRLSVQPVRDGLLPIILDKAAEAERLWGTALASHLEGTRVAHRMAEAAQQILGAAAHRASIETRYETSALQPGATLALFADLAGGLRLGADMAGAPGRRAELIGQQVAKQLLEEIKAGATLDRHAADQMIPFAALADGQSRFRIAAVTDHIESNAWLAREFLQAEVNAEEQCLSVTGVGFRRRA